MIGVIADDVTGATDVAVAFRRTGLRCGVYFGTPDASGVEPGLDVVVIALKSRTIPAPDAVKQSLAAAETLQTLGARQLFFKYCSTFDSTAEGNIGPVLDALVELVRTDAVVTTPASPEHRRTTFNGHLFVNEELLSESSMRNHPLTPMRDSSLTRLMDAQSDGGSVVIGHEVVGRGPDAVSSHVESARHDARYLFPDAATEDDLFSIAQAVLEEPLVAGAAGLAGAIGRAHGSKSAAPRAYERENAPSGRAIVLAGSCSRRTLEQIDRMLSALRPAHRLDALGSDDPESLARGALDWYDALPAGPAPLIYSSLPPAERRVVQDALGVERSAEILESAIALIARGLRERGVTRFVAAGGETSGSLVAALGIRGGVVGLEAARGVPWIRTDQGLDVLLKSGNFGEADLLLTASERSA
ncbi:Hrp-dependent type III effector protein [Streptomyces dioscori]|uniref:3-oxo-tetronate kinase n=1 Tax=Streptomyces dioscori TaxID=2109333 RepID=A0A2P8Q2C2_9ACTN|nr:3-oxo-tetronate kinase [Streptomyces dioscori]PSM40380.1 Hrp-dependent type III effector protein [Streptomyces dioscori]